MIVLLMWFMIVLCNRKPPPEVHTSYQCIDDIMMDEKLPNFPFKIKPRLFLSRL